MTRKAKSKISGKGKDTNAGHSSNGRQQSNGKAKVSKRPSRAQRAFQTVKALQTMDDRAKFLALCNSDSGGNAVKELVDRHYELQSRAEDQIHQAKGIHDELLALGDRMVATYSPTMGFNRKGKRQTAVEKRDALVEELMTTHTEGEICDHAKTWELLGRKMKTGEYNSSMRRIREKIPAKHN
jgi:hypothetical protein